MRLKTLSLAIAAALSTVDLSLAYADENCANLEVSAKVDISSTSPDRCLPGKNSFQDQQWNLLNNGQDAFSLRGGTPGADLNLWWAHRIGVSGLGVNVAVVDDGIDIAHPDLSANIRPGSKNFLNDSNDPSPLYPEHAHGTSVAGIIGAVDNEIGIKGVAPKVKLQGFNVLAKGLNQTLDDYIYSLGGSPASQDNRLFNQSYGVSAAAAENSEGLDLKRLEAIYESKTLQNKNGATYVKAAGNGFGFLPLGEQALIPINSQPQIPFLNSNIEPNNTNFWNLVVSAINADGVRASYSSVGSNIFVAAPGGEDGVNSPAHVTTDLRGCNMGYSMDGPNIARVGNRLHHNPTLDPNCDYNGVMNGTSSATPNTTGSLALLISAYSDLSPRDLRDILARTSTRIDPDHAPAVLNYPSTAGTKQVTVLEGWEKMLQVFGLVQRTVSAW
ncbi:S8 family serine peptidase [Ectopseudomonas mendocina]|uniref:S8 family serine peptidase n=1 Tax=Ectopseudomonas mendocina TaxID=300 RepID=A0ABZ2RJJ3_ECTME